MEDNYLKLFGNMFYNIKEDQDNKKIIEEASEVLASIIIKYGELINEITARTSAQDEFVDTVICLFLRKIMEQLDALNILIDAGAFSPMQAMSGFCICFIRLKRLDQMKCQVITFVHSILFCHFSCHRKFKICSFRGTAKTGN